MTLDAAKEAVLQRIRGLRGLAAVDSLLTDLVELGEVVIVGGGPRDWLLGKEPRDLDFVVNTRQGALASVLEPRQVRRNRYGGYKLLVENFQVDVWSLEATWAFSYLRVKSPTLDDLPRTAFYNVDAIAVSILDGTVYDGGFEAAVRDKELSVIFAENPFPVLCAARGLALAKRYGFRLGRSVVQYIDTLIADGLCWQQIDSAQRSHYGLPFVCSNELDALLPRALSSQLRRNVKEPGMPCETSISTVSHECFVWSGLDQTRYRLVRG